jgi:multidrug resistance protein
MAESIASETESIGRVSLLERIRANKNTVVAVTALSLFNDLLIYGIVVPILPDYSTELGAVARLWSPLMLLIIVIRMYLAGASSVEVGFLFSAYSIGLLIATPFFGVFGDRYGRRKPILVALVGLALSTLCFAIGSNFWVLVLARLIQGASAAGTWVCGMAILYDSFPPDVVGSKLGLVSLMYGVGYMCGPLIGGLLYRYVSYQSSFLLCAALVVLDGIGRFFLIPDVIVALSQAPITERDMAPPPLELDCNTVNSAPHVEGWADLPHPDPFGTDTAAFSAVPVLHQHHVTVLVAPTCHAEIPIEFTEEASFRSLWRLSRDPYISTNLTCWMMATAIFSSLEPILPLHFARPDVLDATADEVGALMFSLVVPYVITCYPAGMLADKYRKRNVMLVGLILLLVFSPIATLPRTDWLEVISLIPIGIGLGLSSSPASADSADYVERRGWTKVSAQVASLINIAYSFGSIAGPMLASVLVEVCGATWAFVLLSALTMIAVPFIYRGYWISSVVVDVVDIDSKTEEPSLQ